jgi:hypothetical protein
VFEPSSQGKTVPSPISFLCEMHSAVTHAKVSPTSSSSPMSSSSFP